MVYMRWHFLHSPALSMASEFSHIKSNLHKVFAVPLHFPFDRLRHNNDPSLIRIGGTCDASFHARLIYDFVKVSWAKKRPTSFSDGIEVAGAAVVTLLMADPVFSLSCMLEIKLIRRSMLTYMKNICSIPLLPRPHTQLAISSSSC